MVCFQRWFVASRCRITRPYLLPSTFPSHLSHGAFPLSFVNPCRMYVPRVAGTSRMSGWTSWLHEGRGPYDISAQGTRSFRRQEMYPVCTTVRTESGVPRLAHGRQKVDCASSNYTR